jgi:hypothetical protein
MTKLKAKSAMFLMMVTAVAVSFVLFAAMVRMEAAPRARNARAQAVASRVSVDADDIGGVVTSSKGPEAGVWVIAETTDLPTKFRKIVVTDDQGQYLLPQLPKAHYKVWVRGYGLVDSMSVEAMPGQTLALTAVIAPTPQAAAQYYPADYWASLLKIPPKSAFPITVPPPPPLPGVEYQANPTHGVVYGKLRPPNSPIVIDTQAEWLFGLKGCWTCHQVGVKSTREIPASLGTFKTSSQAWERFMLSGQVGRGMIQGLDRLGHDEGLAMYADWGDRIAKGEVPPAPPRPQGTERNVVVTVWDWSVRASFLHALISTDKRNPSVNANGPIYGAVWSEGALAAVDPVKNTAKMIHIPLPDENDRAKLVVTSPQSQIYPSLYFGDELVWNDPVNPGPITMDGRGRVWFNVENRVGNAEFCKAGSQNPYAKNSPREVGAKGVDVYDPETGKFDFADLCFKSTRIAFSDDKDDTLYFSVQVDGGIGWINVRRCDKTHDSEKSQGWCPAVIDYNGDGKIGPYTKGNEPPDPKLDREVARAGAYGIAYNPVDGSVWYSSLITMPGRLFRMVKGANPPSTCLTEVYEVPYDPTGQTMGGSHPRGISIDGNGVVWTPLTGEGYLASFDRRKCKVLPVGQGARTEAAATGKQCREGWTFYPIPGPTFKSDPTVKADYNYYMWVDQYNSLGLGKNVVIVDGANSDSLVAFQQDTKEWVRMTLPYPMGFFSRFFDARVDDPNAGWKGRGIWAGNEARGTQLTEGGKNMPSQLAHFQIRPAPLAK